MPEINEAMPSTPEAATKWNTTAVGGWCTARSSDATAAPSPTDFRDCWSPLSSPFWLQCYSAELAQVQLPGKQLELARVGRLDQPLD